MCPIHHFIFSTNDIKRMREKYPDHTIIVHPECQLNVIKEVDFASSTKGMADFVAENDKVILGTEVGLVEALQDKYPQKSILPLSNMAVCIDMKTTIEEILNTRARTNEIIIEPEIAKSCFRNRQYVKILEITNMKSVSVPDTDFCFMQIEGSHQVTSDTAFLSDSVIKSYTENNSLKALDLEQAQE